MMARIVKALLLFAEIKPAVSCELIAACGLTPEQIDNDDGTIPLHQGFAVFEAAASAVRDPALGLRFGSSFSIGGTGPLGFAVVSSRTVGEALETISRFMPLVASMRYSRYEKDAKAGTIVWQYSGSDATPRFQFVTWGVAVVMNRIAAALPIGWRPREVVIDGLKPTFRKEHRDYFGPGLRWERGVNRFAVQAEFLDRPMPQANPRLFDLMTRLAEIDQRQVAVRGSEFEVEVRAVISQLLREGKANARSISEALGLTVRALRTQLRAHALDVRTLIDDVRRETALAYLLETDLNMTEISFALGYSDSSIFTRSCHKWFGRPPSEVRVQGVLS
jgi:AraC-like DNA-binding protein